MTPSHWKDAAIRLPRWWLLYRRESATGDAQPLWKYLPGVRSWDDPVWAWAVQIHLPFGLTIRFGKGGRA
jgi:hypothetical protein